MLPTINAPATQINRFYALQLRNMKLRQKVARLKAYHESLLALQTSTADRAEVLVVGLRHADAEVILKITPNLMLLVLLETLTLLFAYIPVSPKLRGWLVEDHDEKSRKFGGVEFRRE